MKSHYTYRLIALNPVDERVEYIGVRSCNGLPENDTRYQGSSKHLPHTIQYRKEIIAVWPTREEAVAHEVALHDFHDVARSPRFFNKAKQTSVGFDTAGLEGNRKGIPHKDETKRKVGQTTSQQKWWNNGVIQTKSKTKPGLDFVRGGLPRGTPNWSETGREAIREAARNRDTTYMVERNKSEAMRKAISLTTSGDKHYSRKPGFVSKLCGASNPTKRPEVAAQIATKALKRNQTLRQYFELSDFVGNKRTVTMAQAEAWLAQHKGTA